METISLCFVFCSLVRWDLGATERTSSSSSCQLFAVGSAQLLACALMQCLALYVKEWLLPARLSGRFKNNNNFKRLQEWSILLWEEVLQPCCSALHGVKMGSRWWMGYEDGAGMRRCHLQSLCSSSSFCILASLIFPEIKKKPTKNKGRRCQKPLQCPPLVIASRSAADPTKPMCVLRLYLGTTREL